MLRHWDIRLIVIVVLGAAAYGLVFLLQNFSLHNVPDENVVYIDSAVGGIEDDNVPVDASDEDGREAEAANRDTDNLELNLE